MVELKGRPERKIKGSTADGFQRVGEGIEALTPEALRPENDGRARNQPGKDAAERADPVIIDGPFQKKVVAMSSATMPMRLKS